MLTSTSPSILGTKLVDGEPNLKKARTMTDEADDYHSATHTEDVKSHQLVRGAMMEHSGAGAVLWKNCMQTRRYRKGKEEEVLALGAACSEVFSGKQLADVLRPAIEYQVKALSTLETGEGCCPLSIHTSVGVPKFLGEFTNALKDHLPWAEPGDDWVLNLQITGTDAVHAGIEGLFQVIDAEKSLGLRKDHPYLLATAEKCYHGPHTHGFSQPTLPKWPGAPKPAHQDGQLKYPIPQYGEEHSTYVKRFEEFLNKQGENLGVILFEPQWGGSFAARPWPKKALQEVVALCHSRGILILCDEVLCGLGRHGQGTLFLSKAWGLEPDAAVFGKAVSGGGGYPMAGCLIKKGAKALAQKTGCILAQGHTYAGSSSLAMMSGTEVLKLVPKYFDHAAKMGDVVQEILGPLSDDALCRIHGQGLLWGGHFTDNPQKEKALAIFKEQCEKELVAPFIFPAGFLMTPPMDVKEEDFREALTRIHRALAHTKTELSKQVN